MKDTGIGISPELKEIIFERFRQGSESLNKRFEGIGLGLAISKAYVEMLGGRIWIDTDSEVGSVFNFTIPYCNNRINKQLNTELIKNKLGEKSENKIKTLIA